MVVASRRAVTLYLAVAAAAVAACSSSSGGSAPPADSGIDEIVGHDATPDVAATDAAGETATGDSGATEAAACTDATAGRTETSVCVPTGEPGGPCQTVCDCCWIEPYGAVCSNGHCYGMHGQ